MYMNVYVYKYVYEYAYECIVTIQCGLLLVTTKRLHTIWPPECGHYCFAPGLVDVNSKDASAQH